MGSNLYPAAGSTGWPVRAWLWRAAIAATLLSGGALAVADADSLGLQVVFATGTPKDAGNSASAHVRVAAGPSRTLQDEPTSPPGDQAGARLLTSASGAQPLQLAGSADASDEPADADDSASDVMDAIALAQQDSQRHFSEVRSVVGPRLVRAVSAASGSGAGATSAGRGGSPARPGAAANPKDPAGPGNQLQQTKLADLVAGAVPEPQTWTVLVLGLGLAGAALRRRRRGLS